VPPREEVAPERDVDVDVFEGGLRELREPAVGFASGGRSVDVDRQELTGEGGHGLDVVIEEG